MKVSFEELQKAAKNVLEICSKERIATASDLEKRMGQTISLDPDMMTFEMRPSNYRTQAYTLSYTNPEGGILVEIKLNPDLGYSRIILKSQDPVKGYSPFSHDRFGNIQQEKMLHSSDLVFCLKELSDLQH